MEYQEIVIICYSCISCCFSLTVIATILFFKSMRKGNFMPIILYMSICDVGVSLSSTFGFPRNESPLCWIQGLLLNFSALAGWFWTTILAYRVYCFVRYGRCTLQRRHMHLIAWGLSAFLTFIPLTTTDYGSENPHTQSCIYYTRGNSPEWLLAFWAYTSFFVWLFICILVMLAWQLIVYIKYRNTTMKDVVSRTYDKLYLYPIAMSVCWMLSVWCNALAPHSKDILYQLNIIFATSNGILSTLIFMVKSEEARRRWAAYFESNKRSTFDESADPSIRLDFECDGDDDFVDMSDRPTNQSSMFTSDVEISDITMSDMGIENPISRMTR